MKLSYVAACGFRGYRKPLRVDFAEGFTVIEGRNGVGKSTICDAVEFVLTGTIGKYLEAKAAGETVADYIWWSGEGPKPIEHYVEVGFHDGEREFVVRREQFADAEPKSLVDVVVRLCDVNMQPSSPLAQLCKASIIRDEHIAALSLDLGERERFTLLRDAIGATDADVWVERGKQLVASAKKRVQTVQAEANTAAQDVTESSKHIDELRAAIVEEGLMAGAVARLQAATGSTAAPDQIAEVARTDLIERTKRRDEIRRLADEWQSYETRRDRLSSLTKKAEEATALVVAYELALEDAPTAISEGTAQEISQRARDLAALAKLGRQLGLNHNCCPLCASGRSHSDYERGIAAAEALARQLDAAAVEQQDFENRRRAIEERLADARDEELQADALLDAGERAVKDFETRLKIVGFAPDQGRSPVVTELSRLDSQVQRMQEDLRMVQTLRTNIALERAVAAEQATRTAYAKAQERLGIAQRGLTYAEGLNQGAQRAAGETLEQRLDRVLPLMTELYRRLRPHPLWNDIDYKIRGDVRRFLSLKVGDELNPQFIFSSGQRRATGLAFLLSVNLSLAWSRWQTILLDDPVQHVDDFRSVHLAEVMAQLISAGRQIVCVVEDPALADHLCRRLPVLQLDQGARVSLGPDEDGALSMIERKIISPLPTGALVQRDAMATG